MGATEGALAAAPDPGAQSEGGRQAQARIWAIRAGMQSTGEVGMEEAGPKGSCRMSPGQVKWEGVTRRLEKMGRSPAGLGARV